MESLFISLFIAILVFVLLYYIAGLLPDPKLQQIARVILFALAVLYVIVHVREWVHAVR